MAIGDERPWYQAKSMAYCQKVVESTVEDK